MRRINIIFLFIPILVLALYCIYKSLNRNSVSFFGVAENLETQINLEHPATVNRIYVTDGELVSKGTLLMELSRGDLEFKLSELTHGIEELEARDRLERDEIKGNLERYKALKAEKIGEIQAEIKLLESEQLLNKSLYTGLKSIPEVNTADSNSVIALKIQSLKEQLHLAIEPLDVEISRLEKELRLASIPMQKESGKLKKEIDLYTKEEEQLRIYAPGDGLIGNIHCRPGENIPAFNTLISFYEENPNTVVAYLHESLSLQIHAGDSLRVTSTLHPDEHCMGEVTGMGHRIVEIPERLRKIPEIKTYGREVLIRISSDNNFLQKEKVMLQNINAEPFSLLSLLSKPFSSNS